jgi:hypothetical protein
MDRIDKRKFERHQVQISGKLMWASGARSCACTIKDLSEEGACVEAVDALFVPQTVFLLVDSSQNTFECEVRWRNDMRIGLFFLDTSSRATRSMLIKNHTSTATRLVARYKLTSLSL